MTPKARQRHLVALKKVLTDAGFKQDAYGNFKYPGVDTFRIKFKSNNLRVEEKLLDRWIALESKVWSQLTIEYFTDALEFRKKRILKKLGPVNEPSRATKNSKGVLLTHSLEGPIKAKQMEAIIEKRNHQDYQCYLLVQEMLDLGMIPKVNKDWPANMQDMADIYEKATADIYERATTAVKNRIDLNDKFLRLLSGQ